MKIVLWISLAVAGACAVVLLHSVAADVLGGAVAIAALVGITRSVIRLAGDAGTSGSSPEATSRLR